MGSDAEATRLLVVDDDGLSRELLAVLLEAEGYAVTLAESGEEALRVAAGTDGIDAVLTDMQMPGMAGAALARRLRATCADGVRLLAMSGSRPEAKELRGYDGFLLKPLAMEELAELLEDDPMPGMLVDLAAGAAIEEPSVEQPAIEQEDGELDGTTFASLAEMMRPEQMTELYTMGLKDGAVHVAAMRTAALAGDAVSFKQRAHAMKGSFGMLGARVLQAMAADMEVQGPHDTNEMVTLERFTFAMGSLRRILSVRGLSLDLPSDEGDCT